jgi:hypothetical protein
LRTAPESDRPEPDRGLSPLSAESRIRRIADRILAVQPVFAVPVYFSVLSGAPPLWLSLVVAIIPLGIRFWLTRRFLPRTPFDVPILIFMLGTLVGLLVASNKAVAVGALGSTAASILIYYGLVGNGERGNRYWLSVAGVICAITMVLAIWFFSEGTARYVSFNTWFFKLFAWLPKTGGSVLQFNSLGALLAVVVPGLGAIALFPGHRRLRIAAFSMGLVCLVLLILSASGGGWIAGACGVGFVLFSWRRRSIMALASSYAAFFLAIGAFYHRWSWAAPTFSTGSLASRFHFWRDTVELMIGGHLVTGLGLGGWLEVFTRQFGQNPGHIHNNYLQLFADTGVLGVLALVAAAIVFMRLASEAVSLRGPDGRYGVAVGLAGGIVAGAVMAMYDVTTTVTVQGGIDYVYLSVPFLWVWAALFAVWSQKRFIRGEVGSSGEDIHPDVQ